MVVFEFALARSRFLAEFAQSLDSNMSLSWHVDVNVDICEYCREVEGILIVGCYVLNSSTGTRSLAISPNVSHAIRDGRLYLYDHRIAITSQHVQKLTLPGLFDAKWLLLDWFNLVVFIDDLQERKTACCSHQHR